ncbi:LysR family transcriptional regulator [Sodalis sp. dw_96]|uniref:LysR family transcriptional regulator n=1 Tax=Sodalis sp. dw_96 TaxID=2719794 RepID=UPI001BD64C82|nr:LysR family transcriptional regulator [Sodalis sp. dw_96]
MDRIDLFRILIQVVERGSFTRAADVMNMPRSTVSAAVAELETRVGTRLLHRTTRSVSLTSDGRAFYERCLRVIPEVEETENLFRQKTIQPTGKIKIDVPGRIGRLIIAPSLPEFFARYPQMTLEMGTADRNVSLAEEGIDCALRVGKLPDSSLVARKLGTLKFINVAAPAYIARHGKPHTPSDLPRHLAVNYASPTTGRVENWEWPENDGYQSAVLPSQITVNNAEAYIACCLAGLGMIQIPQYDVQKHLEAGELIEVMPDYPSRPLPVQLLYPHRKHLSRPLQTFIAWAEPLLVNRLLLNAPD